MNEKINKNAKVEKITIMLGTAVRLIVIDPLTYLIYFYIEKDKNKFWLSGTSKNPKHTTYIYIETKTLDYTTVADRLRTVI